MSPRFPARQRGAIGLVAALTLAMGLLFVLMVVDSSRLFLEQRKLQRIADMAALEAAGQLAVCSGTGPLAAALARASAVRNGFELTAGQALDTTCGSLQTGANSLRHYSVDATRHEAIRVVASSSVATSVAAGVLALARGNPLPDATRLSASAVAATPKPPQAMLRIRSSAATLDSRQSPLLNALVDPLGGHVQLDLLGWQNLANTQINLLDYLDQLAIDVGVSAGNYQQLLSADATATQLVQAAAQVLQRSGAAAEVVTNLGKIAAGADDTLPLQLGSILNLQSGTTQAGLDAGLRVLDLVQSVILLSTRESAATVELPISLLGLVNGKVRLKVIEPQQLSAVGNPQTDTIRVHTAQVRALVSLELPVLSTVAGLLNAVLNLASPLTNVLDNLLSLNVMGTLQSLTCALGIPCKVTDIRLLPGTVSVDVGVNVAKASSEVSDYSCTPEKTLTARTQSAAVDVAIGQFKNPEDFFSTGIDEVTPLPLIDIGTNVCSRLLFLPPICGTRVAFAGGGIGLKIKAPLLGSNSTDPASDLRFAAPDHTPPDINQPPVYLGTTSSDIITSLDDTIAGIEVHAYEPVNGNVLGAVINQVAGLLDDVADILKPLVKGLLSPLVEPLVNALLRTLGIDLLKVEVGANLTCSSSRAQLMQ